MKRTLCIIVVIMALVISVASAGILSDSEFDSANAQLTNSKTVSFSAETFERKNCIKVTTVKLYKLNDNDTWTISNLPAPEQQATNAKQYGATMDYSSYIGSGTYRIKVTFWADGHSLSRFSNSKTY